MDFNSLVKEFLVLFTWLASWSKACCQPWYLCSWAVKLLPMTRVTVHPGPHRQHFLRLLFLSQFVRQGGLGLGDWEGFLREKRRSTTDHGSGIFASTT
jgi:hypothetical protein